MFKGTEWLPVQGDEQVKPDGLPSKRTQRKEGSLQGGKNRVERQLDTGVGIGCAGQIEGAVGRDEECSHSQEGEEPCSTPSGATQSGVNKEGEAEEQGEEVEDDDVVEFVCDATMYAHVVGRGQGLAVSAVPALVHLLKEV